MPEMPTIAAICAKQRDSVYTLGAEFRKLSLSFFSLLLSHADIRGRKPQKEGLDNTSKGGKHEKNT